jgi:hypothetical protein
MVYCSPIVGTGDVSCEVGCDSCGFGIAFVCLVLMKMMAMIRMTKIYTAKAMTTGRKDESLLRASGVGSLLDRIGSVMVIWMHGRVVGFAFAGAIRGRVLVRRRRSAGCWSGCRLSGRLPDRRTHDQKKIEKEDCDQDKTADEDVRSKSHVRFMAGKIGRRDVSVLGVAFMHAHQLRRKVACVLEIVKETEVGVATGYSSRPGRDMSSRMASLGLLLR